MNLTVIIPVYNGAAGILRCLSSLEEQTYQDFCILLIDDGSTDGSSDVIEEYMLSHMPGRIRLIRQTNAGAAAARNSGILETDTEYLAFVDQDDYVTPDYLETYIRTASPEEADVICGGYRRVHPESGKTLRTVSPGKDDWAKYTVVSPWAHMYRTAFLKENGIRFLDTRIGEDVFFTLTAYANTERVITIPDTGYCWVDNPDSLSNSKQRKIRSEVDPLILLNMLWDHLPEKNCLNPQSFEYFLYRYIVWYLLFTVRRTSTESVTEQYIRLTEWLRKRCPRFEYNTMISLFRPKGEPVGIRLAVWGFTVLYRCRLALPLLRAAAGRKKVET